MPYTMRAVWSSWTAPENEFATLAGSVFIPMYYSSTYTIPGSGEGVWVFFR